jgi:hypothetical protein
MNVVGHQAISMNGRPITDRQLFPQIEVEQIVLGFDEAGFAVIAALDDVVR